MEWGGSWWTGTVHEYLRTETYAVTPRERLFPMDADARIFVEGESETGHVFKMDYTRSSMEWRHMGEST
eukprot:2778753-Amphidinium_carterae.1